MTAEAWVEWITRPQGMGQYAEFTLACQHSSVTSEQMKDQVGVDYSISLLRQLKAQYPEVPEPELILGEVRLLMGWMLSAVARCECASRPWVVVSDPDHGYRIENVP